MRYENRTPVQLGMGGAFAGIQYRVAGRVVMSMDEGGTTYYWDEFNLLADDGRCATLVCEDTDSGVQWRLFTLIEPDRPISVAEAAQKRVGEPFEIGGTRLRITTVDESRVCHIEGEAPEGVEEGDVAHYFNAESGNEMVVVSWTGDEVECYRGLTLPTNAVSQAFNLPSMKGDFFQTPLSTTEPERTKSSGGTMVVVIILVGLVMVGLFSCKPWRRAEKTGAPSNPKLPAAPLALGASGRVGGNDYRIAKHTTVEVGLVGRRFLRHEYQLVDSAGAEALLVCGEARDKNAWTLLVPFTPESPITPMQAAALRTYAPVKLGTAAAVVTNLFRVMIKSAGSAEAETILFGFSARGAGQDYVVRWNQTNITFYRATQVPGRATRKAFHA